MALRPIAEGASSKGFLAALLAGRVQLGGSAKDLDRRKRACLFLGYFRILTRPASRAAKRGFAANKSRACLSWAGGDAGGPV
jgi:hypothetical protein